MSTFIKPSSWIIMDYLAVHISLMDAYWRDQRSHELPCGKFTLRISHIVCWTTIMVGLFAHVTVSADCLWAVVVLTELHGARGSHPAPIDLYTVRPSAQSYCPSIDGWLSHRWAIQCRLDCPCHRRPGHLTLARAHCCWAHVVYLWAAEAAWVYTNYPSLCYSERPS